MLIATIQTRMAREYASLGTMAASTDNDIILDATSHYMKCIDLPIISASLSVNDAAVEYDIPDSISKIQDIRDESGDSVAYSIDLTTGQIILSTEPASALTYTVYGTYNLTSDTLSAIIAVLPIEDSAYVYFSFIKAYVYSHFKKPEWANQMQAAIGFADHYRQNKNIDLSVEAKKLRINDMLNRDVEVSGNAENRSDYYSEMYDTEL